MGDQEILQMQAWMSVMEEDANELLGMLCRESLAGEMLQGGQSAPGKSLSFNPSTQSGR